MKCPNDQSEMEMGVVGAYHGYGEVQITVVWGKEKPESFKLTKESSYIIKKAWKCPECGKVELDVEEEK